MVPNSARALNEEHQLLARRPVVGDEDVIEGSFIFLLLFFSFFYKIKVRGRKEGGRWEKYWAPFEEAGGPL